MRAMTIVGVVALLVLAGAASAAAPGRAGCTPGSFTEKGSSGVVFCGPAKATAKVGRKTYAFGSGSCIRTSKYLDVNIGTEVLSGPKRKYSYFAILVGEGTAPDAKPASKDGTYTGGLVTVRWKGKDYVLNGVADKSVKITLEKGRTAGTFSGSTFLAPHLKVTGSFSC
jgi:hypothetical protein